MDATPESVVELIFDGLDGFDRVRAAGTSRLFAKVAKVARATDAEWRRWTASKYASLDHTLPQPTARFCNRIFLPLLRPLTLIRRLSLADDGAGPLLAELLAGVSAWCPAIEELDFSRCALRRPGLDDALSRITVNGETCARLRRLVVRESNAFSWRRTAELQLRVEAAHGSGKANMWANPEAEMRLAVRTRVPSRGGAATRFATLRRSYARRIY